MTKRYYKEDRGGGVWSDDYKMPDEEKTRIISLLNNIPDSEFNGFIVDIEPAIETYLIYRESQMSEKSFIKDEVGAIKKRADALKEVLDNCHQHTIDFVLQGYLVAGGDVMSFPERLSDSLGQLSQSCDRMRRSPSLKGTKANTLENMLGMQVAKAFEKWLPDNAVSNSKNSVFVKILGVLLKIVGSDKSAETVANAVVRRLKSQ